MSRLHKHILAGTLLAIQPSFAIAGNAEPTFSTPISCEQAASNISSLPSGLLGSIGLVESGHVDEDGRTRPWPYTVDVNGNGYWFTNADAAIQFTENAIQHNAKSIDVGCFQVNLQAHPQAFSSLQEAFSPQENANYAAKYLNQLYQQYGNWSKAVGAYHSANSYFAEPYIKSVMSVWNGSPEQGYYISLNNTQQRFTGQWVAMNQSDSYPDVQVFYRRVNN